MRAVLFPGESVADLVELARPEPGPADVLIRLTYSSVCGTDVHYWRQTADERRQRSSIVPGHEAVGVVEQVGPGVDHLSPGDRVVVGLLHIGCGRCRTCMAGDHVYCARKDILGGTLHGSYGQFVCVPDYAVYRLLPDLSAEAAVIASCNLATAYSALRKTQLGRGRRLVVFGLGGVGLCGVLVGLQMGAEVIAIDPVAERRDKSLQMGAVAAYSPDEGLESLRDGTLQANVALECSGNAQAQEMSLSILAPGGQVVVVGLGGGYTFQPGTITGREITISGSAVCRPDEFFDVLDLATRCSDQLVSLLGPRFTIDQVDVALRHSSEQSGGKPLFEW